MKTNNKVVSELKKIANANGGILRPDEVVEAARPVASPLHAQFEWDDTRAAQQHRLWQARMLIRVCVQVLPSADGDIEERVWVSLKRDRQTTGYRPLVDVLSDEQLRDELLSEALETLEYWQEKYGRLEELAGVFREIRKVRAQRKPATHTGRARA